MMVLKVVLLLWCIVYQGYSKPVERDDEPNDVEEGVAAIVSAIDELLEKSDDLKTSEIRDLAQQLLTETSEFENILDTLILETSDGQYIGKRMEDVPIRRPIGSAATRLNKEDVFIAALFNTLEKFKEAMTKVAENYNPDAAKREVLQTLRVLKQITWGIRQVCLSLLQIVKYAENDFEELGPDVDEDVEEEEKILKRRNWSFNWQGAHWNRGNHHFQAGPTFGKGGFGGGATYTWRFQ